MAIKLDKSMLAKNLVLNHKLVQHLDKAMGTELEWTCDFKPKEGDDAWHPSGDCTPTPYDLYHKALGQEYSTPSVSLMKTFTVGHFWHGYIQHVLVERLGFCTWDEVERRGTKIWGVKGTDSQLNTAIGANSHYDAKPYHWATGSADVAPCRIPGHGEYLVDIKTMGAHDFRPPKLPAWCATKYECQLNIYMDWFDLDQAIILAVSKDSPHAFKEFHFERNQPLVDAIYSKWRLVGDCLDQGVEPDEDFDIPLPVQGPS